MSDQNKPQPSVDGELPDWVKKKAGAIPGTSRRQGFIMAARQFMPLVSALEAFLRSPEIVDEWQDDECINAYLESEVNFARDVLAKLKGEE